MGKKNTLAFFEENYPLIKIVDFDTTSKLFYDARANMVFVVNNEDIPVIVEYLRKHDEEEVKRFFPEIREVDEIITRIDGLINKGVLLPGPVAKLISTESQDVKARMEYNLENIFMRKFVLETTQQCNFRCKYCHNTIETVFRHHTNKHMTLPIAKAAIDFYKTMYLKFYNKLPEDKKALLLKHYAPFVGFYGGETSLNWGLVEDAYEYYIHLDWENYGIKQNILEFTINSNLYILTDRMLSFILKHKPNLYVSLDGPKEDNDRNRVTLDGKGTFDRVFSNLQKIKKADLKYYKEKVMVLCVEADGNNAKAVHEFIDSLGCRVNYLKEQPYGCLQKNPEMQILEIEKGEQKRINNTIKRYKKRIKEKDPNALEEFESLYFLENTVRDTPYQYRNLSLNLTCPLCVDNIMIDTEGGMHMCHKTDGSLSLGNVCEGGYDMKKMFDAYKSYGETTNCIECRSCWAMNVCSYCAALRLSGGKWFNPKQVECDLWRRHMEYLLKLFVAVYKLDPNIIPKLMERKHDLNYYKSVVDYNEFIQLKLTQE
jgi:uncharacterized protein